MDGKFYFGLMLRSRLLIPATLLSQIVPGDVNNDGKVDNTDIARGMQIALSQPQPATQNEIQPAI